MAKDDQGYYGTVRWHPRDIQELTDGHGEHGDRRGKPGWTLEQCEIWLAKNERYIQSAVTEAGWDIIRGLMPANPNGKNYKE